MSSFFLKTISSILFFLLIYGALQAQDDPFRLGPKIRIDLENTVVTADEIKVELLVRGYSLDSLVTKPMPEIVNLVEGIILALENRGKPAKKDTVVQIVKTEAQATTPIILQAPRAVAPRRSPPPPPQPKKEEPKPKPPAPPTKIGIWGQHIFRDSSIFVYETSEDAKPPETYILGVGDEITVSIFGRSQADLRYEINEEGYISPEGMTRIFLKGITYKEAKRLLRQRFAEAYIFLPEQFTASITGVRNININIFGEVKKTGSYLLPAINSAFNAIMATGGPTDIGSVRNIQLIRDGQVKILDVYDFMLDPSLEFQYQLKHNDVINVPVCGRVVLIKGAINRVFRYELIEGEHLISLLEYAGGLRQDAYTEHIQIMRYQDTEKILIDVNYKELMQNGGDFELLNGDEIIVKTIPEAYENFATIKGAVEQPGKYALDNKQRISDVVKKAVLQEGARTDVAYLSRKNPDKTTDLIRLPFDRILRIPGIGDDLILKPGDIITILNQSNYVDRSEVHVAGAVRKPTSLPYDPDQNMRVLDLVTLAGGLQPNAAKKAYIRRQDPNNKDLIDYLYIDLENAMKGPNAYFNFALRPNDRLVVYTKERYTELYKIKVEGAVNEPGTFDFDEELLLSNAIYLSGQLKPTANQYAYIQRTAIENPDLKTYMRVDIQKAVEMPGSGHDLVLQPLDHIFVLDNPSYTDKFEVKVLGAVRNPGQYQFGANLEVKDLITLAGGMKFEADSSHIDVYRLDFEGLESTRHFVTTLKVDRDYNLISPAPYEFQLQAYDHIVVRQIPGFEEQRLVKIEGEVLYPGFYAITKANQKVSDLVEEAGGFLDEAYPRGSTLYRKNGNKGFIVLSLDKAVNSSNSKENVILKDGDVITVPKKENVVYIRVKGTKAGDLYPEKYEDTGVIALAYQGKKSARWYINNFAAGYSKTAKKNTTTIEKMNQGVQGTKRILFLKEYPSVERGATVGVGLKPPKKVRQARQGGNKVDLENTLGKTLSALTSVLGLVLLLNQLNQ